MAWIQKCSKGEFSQQIIEPSSLEQKSLRGSSNRNLIRETGKVNKALLRDIQRIYSIEDVRINTKRRHNTMRKNERKKFLLVAYACLQLWNKGIPKFKKFIYRSTRRDSTCYCWKYTIWMRHLSHTNIIFNYIILRYVYWVTIIYNINIKVQIPFFWL